MPFSSVLFISVFLPLFLLAYFAGGARLRNGVALLFSVVFYAWGAPRFLPFILALGVIDYHLGKSIAASTTRKKLYLTLGVTVHLSILAYFKYSNFFVGETNALLAHFAVPPMPWKEVILPIGISFLTFEEISYLTDIYRGDARPAKSVLHYLLFLMLFPHSIAGPIFRWKDLEAQLASRSLARDEVAAGFHRFSLGLGKKVLLADTAALAADRVFGADPHTLPAAYAWLGVFAYTLQIYFDFSGYSDMAIGLGRMIGFQFKENFNHPYISQSVTEFWRRWHISLSTWLRDYLYVALGGNRAGPTRAQVNVLLVFAASGFWHGANWTYLVWGIYHGVWVVAERTQVYAALQRRLPPVTKMAVTFLVVMVGWVFFRAPTLGHAVAFLEAMIGVHAQAADAPLVVGEVLQRRTAFLMLFATALAFAPFFRGSAPEPASGAAMVPRREAVLAWAWGPLLFLASIAHMLNSKYKPLIYFKF